MAFEPRQTSLGGKGAAWARDGISSVETWLEREREQVPLWVPIGLGIGIAAWFILPDRMNWLGFCCAALMLSCLGLLLPDGSRLRRIIVSAGMLACIGCTLVWAKAVVVGEQPLKRASFALVTGEVTATRPMPAQSMVRVMLRPRDAPHLPSMIRVNIAEKDVPPGLGAGAILRFRVRLMPPAPPSVPDGYDFAARAYFQGIGATGKALKPIEILHASNIAPSLRARLFAHIEQQVDGPAQGIAIALATGDQGAIADADADAMRRSGLAHLLSISGLHVTALIGAVILILMRGMALSTRAALDWPLMLIAASGGALAGIGYTLLTGAEVPTMRSCVAALLVLGGLAMGRDAITLRLVATGAIIVLLFWPEALVGPSFQMSFAAVTALVALAEHRRFREFAAARGEIWWRKILRSLACTLMTGIVVELALMPIALFHFHKGGMLGAFANIIAIPLTTFVVMPMEALALLFDVVGIGAPFWWVAVQALNLLLFVAHGVAASPMASILMPTVPDGLFALTIGGILWCLLWRTRWRWLGIAPVIVGVIGMLALTPPDIIVTGDGRHVAIATNGGGMALLRAGAGDYVRDTMSESAGYDGALDSIADLDEARCSTDLCAIRMVAGARAWRLLMTRNDMLVDRASFTRDCAEADIVIADRPLPRWCRPRWLKVDRRLLSRTGGIAIDLDNGHVATVRRPGDAHPWIITPERGWLRRPLANP